MCSAKVYDIIKITKINVIDFITIANTSNATDFGDLTQARNSMSCGSDAHGGLA